MSWGWVNDDSSLKTLLMKCIQWFVCKRKNEMEREKECVKGGRERKSMCICKGWNGVLWSWLKEKDAGWWGFMWCVLGTSEVRAQRCFHSNSSASTHHNCADDVMSGSQCSCVFRSVFNNIIYSYTSGRFFFFFFTKERLQRNDSTKDWSLFHNSAWSGNGDVLTLHNQTPRQYPSNGVRRFVDRPYRQS